MSKEFKTKKIKELKEDFKIMNKGYSKKEEFIRYIQIKINKLFEKNKYVMRNYPQYRHVYNFKFGIDYKELLITNSFFKDGFYAENKIILDLLLNDLGYEFHRFSNRENVEVEPVLEYWFNEKLLDKNV